MDQTETLIDGQASFEGKLTGKNVRIAGAFRGEIHVSGRLHLTDGARVEARAVADAAEIGGDFKGELKARNVTLLEKGRMEGTLEAQGIVMREGAVLNGPVNAGARVTVPTEPAWTPMTLGGPTTPILHAAGATAKG
jgi:cytoskeletal protein CcmA (bactofilin family)